MVTIRRLNLRLRELRLIAKNRNIDVWWYGEQRYKSMYKGQLIKLLTRCKFQLTPKPALELELY